MHVEFKIREIYMLFYNVGGFKPPPFKKKKSPAGFFLYYLKTRRPQADTSSGAAAKVVNLGSQETIFFTRDLDPLAKPPQKIQIC